MKSIKINSKKYGNHTIIYDSEDDNIIKKYKWYIKRSDNVLYAYSNDYTHGHKTIIMHRLILNIQDKSIKIDHKNHNGLDNRKSNLRICTDKQNHSNSRPYKNSTSKYKGVCKNGPKWRAQIRTKNKKFYLGEFVNEQDAALAYNKKAKELFGEFAYINVI